MLGRFSTAYSVRLNMTLSFTNNFNVNLRSNMKTTQLLGDAQLKLKACSVWAYLSVLVWLKVNPSILC